MRDLNDIIEFEDESLTVDFKSLQYRKESNEALIKDIVSMANAKTSEDRFIIIGVNHDSNGNRKFVSIEESFIDDATYQQLIHENVEPELNFNYSPFKYKEFTLGVIRIFNSNNPPYMLKKEYGKLKKGDSFIRKGSHQTRISRADIDFYFSQKSFNSSFNGEVDVKFESSNDIVLILNPPKNLNLPSDIAKLRIEKIIEEKESISKITNNLIPDFNSNILASFPGSAYGHRSIETLRTNLLNVKNTYYKDDLFYVFEEVAFKVNILLENSSDKYLEDASIEIYIPIVDFIYVADQVHRKQIQKGQIIGVAHVPEPMSWEHLNYPLVEVHDEYYLIKEDFGDLKHGLSSTALKVPFRLFLAPDCVSQIIEIKVKIYGKNLIKPIFNNLKIKIVNN